MTDQTTTAFASRLARERADHPFPTAFRTWPERFTEASLGILFPHFAQQDLTDAHALDASIENLRGCVEETVGALNHPTLRSASVASAFVEGLEEIYDALHADAQALFENDPAAESIDQVIFSYPGFYATAIYRLANSLHRLGVPLLPRMVSEQAHTRCGIDIHPAAQIGRSFFIDHGTGIVVGESAVIGDRVKLYQGVTLGAHQVHKRLAGTKRHPTIEDDVVIYAHATILGDIVIGSRSIIGGNVWVTEGVPPNSVVAIRNTVRSKAAEVSQSSIAEFSI
ncbi:serine O-acetyltransferase EpsC [Fimbriimonas ginsengisoli]|uniref:serine O-acetyltransferase n=1 Tax=Fimbriimonas ginsengisoli Gsoil 348 TaxID=661478 RepID=A0A068NL72_FIMGI|nr:serine O-acetyltransferase EpsC [Fimbriimonas ginsengisoli]AIE84328.1 serine acetyltransferase, plasmid [Fimbriimonas ginsengisoli Gsoil 348]